MALSRMATAFSTPFTITPFTPSCSISFTEPRAKATTGVPQAKASIITSPNGSGQLIGNCSARVAQEFLLLVVVDLADIFDKRACRDQRCQHRFVIFAVRGIRLGGDVERDSRRVGDGDGFLRPFLRRDAAEECQIFARLLVLREQVAGQAVIDGGHPSGPRNGRVLAVRNRHNRHLCVRPIDGLQVGQIEAAVQGGQRPVRHRAEQRVVEEIDVEMQHVEFGLPFGDLIEHHHVNSRAGCRNFR